MIFICPFCRKPTRGSVEDSRPTSGGVRRRRNCLTCRRRFTTYEYAEEALSAVVKRNERSEPFNREKLRRSIERAAPPGAVVALVLELVETVVVEKTRPTTAEIADLVGAALARHLRWISANRHFVGVEEFVPLAQSLGYTPRARAGVR